MIGHFVKSILGMKNERIYGISVVDSNNTDYPKLCSPDNASNYSEKYQNGPYCGTHEVKNGKWYNGYGKKESIMRDKVPKWWMLQNNQFVRPSGLKIQKSKL